MYHMLKKIIFFVFAFVLTESAFADSASIPGIQINWTTDVPAKAQLNQKQTPKNTNTESIQADPVPESSVSNIGLLPTSRFFFLKNWRRGFERLITFDDKQQINLELNIADEIANEIKILKNKLIDIQARFDAHGATDRALRAYTTAHRLMREHTIQAWEKLADSDREGLLNKIAQQVSEHSKIFAGTTDSLNATSEKIKPLIDGIMSDLQKTTEELMQKTDARLLALKLGETGKSILQNKFPINETTRADFFDRLIKKASDTARSALQSAKTKILNAIAKKIKSL